MTSWTRIPKIRVTCCVRNDGSNILSHSDRRRDFRNEYTERFTVACMSQNEAEA